MLSQEAPQIITLTNWLAIYSANMAWLSAGESPVSISCSALRAAMRSHLELRLDFGFDEAGADVVHKCSQR